MKIVKIFGIVLAAHVVPLTIFLLFIQGCQSTPRQAADTPVVEETGTSAAGSGNWTNQPGASGESFPAESVLAPTPLGAPLTGLTPAERARNAPTRPDNPGEFISSEAAPPALSASPAPAGPTTYTVVAGDSLWKIARKNGTTIDELTKANPRLKATLQPGDVINLPAGVAPAAPSAGAATGTRAGTPAVTSSAAMSTYTVRPGDALARIAARNGITVAALRQANNLRSDTIQVGQQLSIPVSGPSSPSAAGTADAGRGPAAARGITVTVQSGETLSVIAQRYHVTVAEIMKVNNITDARKVRAGQELMIPGYEPVGGGVVPPAPVSRPAPARAGASTAPQQPPASPPAAAPAPEPMPDLDTLPADAVDVPVVPVDEPVPQP